MQLIRMLFGMAICCHRTATKINLHSPSFQHTIISYLFTQVDKHLLADSKRLIPVAQHFSSNKDKKRENFFVSDPNEACDRSIQMVTNGTNKSAGETSHTHIGIGMPIRAPRRKQNIFVCERARFSGSKPWQRQNADTDILLQRQTRETIHISTWIKIGYSIGGISLTRCLCMSAERNVKRRNDSIRTCSTSVRLFSL